MTVTRGAILLFLIVASCDSPRFPQQTPEEISAARVTQSDAAIYDVVMAAYASNQVLTVSPAPTPPPEYGRPASADSEKKVLRRTVPLHDTTDVRVDPLSPAVDRWFTLSGKRLARFSVRPEAIRDFAVRNRRSTSLKNYKPKTVDLERTTHQFGSPFAIIVSLTLPGYSDGGDSAVVELSVSTSGLSGGGELLFLRKVGGEWQVIAKQPTWIS